MNFQEYQKLSPRTLAPIGEIYGIDYKAMTFADNQDAVEELAVAAEHSHMALGMTTEIVELVEAIENADETNIGEELADIVIYVLGLAEILNINLEKELINKVAKNEKREYKKVNGILKKVK